MDRGFPWRVDTSSITGERNFQYSFTPVRRASEEFPRTVTSFAIHQLTSGRSFGLSSGPTLCRRLCSVQGHQGCSGSHKLMEDLSNLQKWYADFLMEFHPKKCQSLNLTIKGEKITNPYNIHSSHTPDVVDSAKFLVSISIRA